MKSGLAPLSAAVLAVLVSSAAACGSSGDGGNPVTAQDAGTGAGNDASPGDDGAANADADPGNSDHGSPSTTYPAFPVDSASVVDQGGGSTLATPFVITITWPNDPLAATLEDYGDKIGASTFWPAVASEYGIGALTSGPANHVRIPTAAPAIISPTDIANLVQAQAAAALGGGDAGAPDSGAPDAGASDAGAWPAPAPGAIYAVYVHPSSSFQEQGQDVCQFAAGYHDNVYVGSTPISYAVIPRCGAPADYIEETAAHEFIEAATDPFPSAPDSDPNKNTIVYAGFDTDHGNWEVFNGLQDEVADACEFFLDSNVQESGAFNYWVQRSWSNKAGKAGHDPCQPGLSEPYYNTTLFPAQEQSIKVDLTSFGGNALTTKGFATKLNTPVTFQVGFFSDAATTGPFTIDGAIPAAKETALTDFNGAPYDSGAATVTIDKTSGVNGEKAYVTVTPTKAGALKFQLIVIRAVLPGATAHHYLPVLIQNL